jgi:DNA-binding MarR family transcriptional regulator
MRHPPVGVVLVRHHPPQRHSTAADGASRLRFRLVNEDPGETTDPVVDAVVRASRSLVGITVRALASVSDEVTLPQLRTLVVVSSQGAQTVSALADRLDVHASTMTRMCSRLVSRGLVERKPSALDRREVVIVLTAQGQGLVDEVMDKRRRDIDAVVRRMSAEDRDRVISALELFSEAADAPDASERDSAQLVGSVVPQVPQH